MIFLAYSYTKYKLNTLENKEFKNFVIQKVEQFFPNEDYLLPYSNYNFIDLCNKLQGAPLKGNFLKDLPIMMSKCNKLVLFPTHNLYIGSATLLEVSLAKANKLPVFCYDSSKDTFTENFTLEMSEFNEDIFLRNIFSRKIVFT